MLVHRPLGVHQGAPTSDAGRSVHSCQALMAAPYENEFGVAVSWRVNVSSNAAGEALPPTSSSPSDVERVAIKAA
jgi:hypothetical protein